MHFFWQKNKKRNNIYLLVTIVHFGKNRMFRQNYKHLCTVVSILKKRNIEVLKATFLENKFKVM